MVKLIRAKENPILTPSDLPWENMLVFNPGAVVSKDIVYLLYRTQGENDPTSRFGLATSHDGIHFERRENPIYFTREEKFKKFGIEDPRIVQIDDIFYITFTIVSENPQGKINPNWPELFNKVAHIAMISTKDFRSFYEHGIILPYIVGKNASLFPKKTNGEYWLLYRKENSISYFAKSDQPNSWPQAYPVFNKRAGFWDSKRNGIGSPPIETEKGWLLFYHGVDEENIYRLGIMFLDRNDPTKILYRSPEPIFEPETDYETFGFVPNVVFTCGAIEKGGVYYVYYGAADQVIGVATVEKRLVLNLF